MKDLYQKKIEQRTTLLVLFFTIWFGVIIFRLVQLQVIQHPQLKARVIDQNQDKVDIFPRRGTIFDRHGNIFARSISCQSVFFSPFKDETNELHFQKINRLKKILELSAEDIKKIKTRIKKKKNFIYIKRKISSENVEKVKNLDLGGIFLLEESKRFYPQKSLAAHVIGRVNIDNKGQSGIEITYDSILGGKKGERLNLIDAKKRQYRYEILKNPQPGKDLYLTIDETIQYYASRELKKAVLKARAKWGTIIVSHPESGEILAMANYPDFNLNHPPSQLSLTDRIKAIHPGFDPGSTFKIILASAALESKKVSLNDKFDCSKGFRRISGKTIRDHHRYDILTFPEVIIHSSNVGATLISDKLGEKTFYNMIKAYGFGSKTGIDLWAEEKGTFHALDKWESISPASLSIGYEISVTAIQMLQAVNVLANRGVIIPFRITKNIPKKFESYPGEHKRVISSQTAMILTDILTKAVTEGTGKKASIIGFTVAGKTGTAQKLDKKTGRYSSNSHISLFTGFVPAAKPVISMIVVIDEPQGKYYGGEIAAPVFRDIGAYTLQYLQIPQETTVSQPLITARLGRQD